METNTIVISIACMLAVGIIYYYYYQKEKKSIATAAITPTTVALPTSSNHPLQLAAYERLVILAERIALPSLISRSNHPGMNKPEMQQLLSETIKQEFDHNLSQQIYVSTQAWEAIRTLKDQNIHLINQVAGVLPNEANGLDLCKKILDFLMGQQQGNMHTLVQDVISNEAKKILYS
jgi:hypothetical protein